VVKAVSKHSADQFLDGLITVLQPVDGYRAAVDSVLLAAAIPAKPKQAVLELGCGAGVVFMCLAARVANLAIAAVEIQHDLAAIATRNAKTIASGACLVVRGDIHRLPAGIKANSFDQVFANPPFHDAKGHSPSPRRGKNLAHAAADFTPWIKAAHGRLKHRGILTMIIRADRLDEVLAGLAGKFGGIEIIPLWPKAGTPAKRVIVRARKDAKTPLALMPGLTLHDISGGYTTAANNILRDAGALG
jgi:tRNA1(Val) A37 N6-methylase TrmN6